jgi:hypothetical protein
VVSCFELYKINIQTRESDLILQGVEDICGFNTMNPYELLIRKYNNSKGKFIINIKDLERTIKVNNSFQFIPWESKRGIQKTKKGWMYV